MTAVLRTAAILQLRSTHPCLNYDFNLIYLIHLIKNLSIIAIIKSN